VAVTAKEVARWPGGGGRLRCVAISLYNIFFYFKAILWVSIILFPPFPTCKAYPIAILLHDHCAIYVSPPTSLLCAIQHTILVMAISCKSQVAIHI